MNLGIDLGKTIKGPTKEKYNEAYENSLEVISELVKKFNNVYIISRVNSEQRERAIKWLEDKNFYNITGIEKENVYYCFDRRDKALFVDALKIGVFIDDRPEVMSFMKDSVQKILFNPSKLDLKKHANLINVTIVKDWKEIEQLFIHKNK